MRRLSKAKRNRKSKITARNSEARALVKWAAAREGVTVAALRGPSRIRSLSRVRAICGYLARDVAHVPIAGVAREVERDPSTIWRDVEWLEGEMKRDRIARADVGKIAKACAAWIKNT